MPTSARGPPNEIRSRDLEAAGRDQDALVLIVMLLFFAGLYGVLSGRPPAVGEGVLDLNLNGNVVEQPARAEWSDIAGGSRIGQYRLRDLTAALDQAKDDGRVKAV